MVMSTEPQEVEEVVEDIEPEVETGEPTEVEEAPAEETPAVETPAVDDSEDELAPTSFAPLSPEARAEETRVEVQRQRAEIQKRNEADQHRQWQENVAKTARSYEQRLADNGYMPEQAREQALRYVQQEQKFRKLEQDGRAELTEVYARSAVLNQFMEKHKLGDAQTLKDMQRLLTVSFNSPEEMEREVKRIKRERTLVRENAQLKQGRVAPQTFDNSQGSAEATTNMDRLRRAYRAGDRSEAAVRAVRELTFGTK